MSVAAPAGAWCSPLRRRGERPLVEDGGAAVHHGAPARAGVRPPSRPEPTACPRRSVRGSSPRAACSSPRHCSGPRFLGDRLSRSAPSPFTRLLRRYLRIASLSLSHRRLLRNPVDGLRPAPAWLGACVGLRATPSSAIVWARLCLRVIGGRLRVEGPPPRRTFSARLQPPRLRRHPGPGGVHRRVVRRQDGDSFLAAGRHALPFGGHHLHRPGGEP